MGAKKPTIAEIRRAVADYMAAAGCGCCADHQAKTAAEAKLGKLLRVPKYADGSGYDFYHFRRETK
jgi:hypothetical protein